MSAIRIAFSLMIALFAILLLYPRRKVKLQIAAYRSQKDVPVLRADLRLDWRHVAWSVANL